MWGLSRRQPVDSLWILAAEKNYLSVKLFNHLSKLFRFLSLVAILIRHKPFLFWLKKCPEVKIIISAIMLKWPQTFMRLTRTFLIDVHTQNHPHSKTMFSVQFRRCCILAANGISCWVLFSNRELFLLIKTLNAKLKWFIWLCPISYSLNPPLFAANSLGSFSLLGEVQNDNYSFNAE